MLHTAHPKRTSSLFPPHSETFIPNDDDTTLKRNSTYIRHIQSELNLHSLKHEISKTPRPVAPAPGERRGVRRCSVRPKAVSAVNEGRPAELEGSRLRPQAVTRQRIRTIGSISGILHTPPPTPTTGPHAIYSVPNFAKSDNFIHKNRRSSLLPTAVPSYNAPITDSLRVQQPSDRRAVSIPARPAFSASSTTLHVIPEDQVPQWPHGRYYANVSPRRGSDDGTIKRRVKSRQRFSKFVRKVSGLFSRKP